MVLLTQLCVVDDIHMKKIMCEFHTKWLTNENSRDIMSVYDAYVRFM